MKYSCDIIQDLLPLYLDGVCSEESKIAIEQHLSECSDCKMFYDTMREADEIEIDTHDAGRERQKAESFQVVKKKIFRKQIVVTAVTVVVLIAIALTSVGVLKNTNKIVEYEDNISVSMVDGSLVGRLCGSQENYVKIKRVTSTISGQEETYLFFYVSARKWDEIITNPEVFSEYMLCSADKGADHIDAVYYFTGDYTDIESVTDKKLQSIIDSSELLWRK